MDGSSRAEWLFDDFPEERESPTSIPSITFFLSCVLEANQRYQLWSVELGNKDRKEGNSHLHLGRFQELTRAKRAVVERLIIPFLPSFYESPTEKKKNLLFQRSLVHPLKWSLRQFWALWSYTRTGPPIPRSARFQISFTNSKHQCCYSQRREGSSSVRSKHQQTTCTKKNATLYSAKFIWQKKLVKIVCVKKMSTNK